MEEATKKQPNFEPSTDRLILGNFLTVKFDKGKMDFLSYAELSQAIGGRDVQHEARGLLNGARADFTRDHHRLTVVVRNEGIRVSSDPAGVLQARVHHIRRVARKSAKQAGHVLSNETLDAAQKRGILTHTAQLGAIMQFAGTTAQKQIEGRIDQSAPQRLALLPTIDAVRAQFSPDKTGPDLT